MILVIDDEPGITELLTDILEYAGHPVLIANDARTAMEFIHLHRPEVVLIDLMMPSVDGLSLAMTLKHNPLTRNIPLVAMSASSSALDMASSKGDFDATIRKPFDNDTLVSLIERFSPVAS